MTYSILSLESGNIIESYGSEDRAIMAAARILETAPKDSFAVVVFDDRGIPVETLEGPEIVERRDLLAREATLT
jgi:hypothetical protein